MIHDHAMHDGLTSMATNLGKSQQNTHYQKGLSLSDNTLELEALWQDSWIVQKICSNRARDMTRRWREITSNELSAEQLEKIDALERQLKLKETLEKACLWSSFYGGVAILIVTDYVTLNQPLMPTEKIQRLVLLNKNTVQAQGEINQNIFDANFGGYDAYLVNSELVVHHSRLIIFNAIPRALSDLNSAQLWGLSDLDPVYDTLKRFDALSINTGDLVSESKVDVFKMTGLTEAIAAGREVEISQSMSAVQLIKSTTNCLLLDKANDYEQKELSFAGVKDLLVEFRNAVAGAANMPVTILFGQSVSGLASGDEDIQNYHEFIHALQESRLRPVFERLDPLIATMAIGFYPSDWWFEFVSLEEITLNQRIGMLNTFSTAVTSLIDNGVLSELQVANELKELGLFNNISIEDLNVLEELARDIEHQHDFETAEKTAENQDDSQGENQ